MNWTISPTYAGPGTCAITGATGSQALSCSFGTITASQTFTIGLLSPSSSIGTYTDTTTTVFGTQQILSIATLAVQGITATFSNLTPSQTIQAGTASITLSGAIGNGEQFPVGETVSIAIGSVTQQSGGPVRGQQAEPHVDHRDLGPRLGTSQTLAGLNQPARAKAKGQEVRRPSGGHILRPRADPLRVHAVVGGEHRDAGGSGSGGGQLPARPASRTDTSSSSRASRAAWSSGPAVRLRRPSPRRRAG